MNNFEITSAAFTNASHSDVRAGLIGYVTCVLNDTLLLDGITLRRTQAGRLTLSYPARRDGAGRQHHVVRPLDDDARRDLERQIFAKLGVEQEVAS